MRHEKKQKNRAVVSLPAEAGDGHAQAASLPRCLAASLPRCLAASLPRCLAASRPSSLVGLPPLLVETTTTFATVATTDDPVLSSLFFVGLLSTTLALGILKLTAYSQLEIVRTAMLSRHVKNGGAKVLQLGGTTRDLYYYPAKTLSVSVNLLDGGPRTQGLFEQAGIQVGIPTTATAVPLVECLASVPTASLDSVVAFEQFGEVASAEALESIASDISRVLKPGGTFIFYERIARDGGFAQLGGKRGSRLDVGGVIAGLDVWDFCETCARG